MKFLHNEKQKYTYEKNIQKARKLDLIDLILLYHKLG